MQGKRMRSLIRCRLLSFCLDGSWSAREVVKTRIKKRDYLSLTSRKKNSATGISISSPAVSSFLCRLSTETFHFSFFTWPTDLVPFHLSPTGSHLPQFWQFYLQRVDAYLVFGCRSRQATRKQSDASQSLSFWISMRQRCSLLI